MANDRILFDNGSDVDSVVSLDNPLPVTAAVAGASAFSSSVLFTRQNNTPTYDANDVVGAATAALTLEGIGPEGGGEVIITYASLRIDVSSIPTGMTSFKLALYDATPPSALADAATWDLPSGDRANFKGFVDLGTPVDLGSTLFVEIYPVNRQITVADGGALYAYLITNGSYTATAQAVYTLALSTVRP